LQQYFYFHNIDPLKPFQGSANYRGQANEDSSDDEELASLVKNMSFPDRLGAAGQKPLQSVSPSSTGSTDF
jgi:hypothetical protein